MTEKDVEMPAQPQDSDWVRVTSTDGFSFMVRRKVANVSGTMKDMLDAQSQFAEAITRTCPVHQRGLIVEKLLEYMAFRAYYESVGSKEEIPVHDFMERVPPEIVLELLLAADYQNM